VSDEGVSISGGTFHGPVAAGKKARATVNNHSGVPPAELAGLQAQLRALADDPASPVTDRAGARDAVDDLEETVAESADGTRLARRLRAVRDRLGEVTAAGALLAAIAQAFGVPWP